MVGKICTVCKSCSFINTELSFFTYPGDPIRRKEWLKAVNRLDLLKKLDNHKTRGNHRICELHFETQYVQKSRLCKARKFLTKDAFPTLCIDTYYNKMHPVTFDYENFLKPTKPIPIVNAQNVVWRKNGTKPFNNTVREEPVVSKYNLRPIKIKDKQYEETIDDDEDNEEIHYKITNEVYAKVKRPVTPQYCDDASRFCESLMKVTQSTQTPTSPRLEKYVHKENNFSKICSKYLSPGLSKLIKWKESSDNGKHVNITLFALNLYYSTNLYNMLSNMLSLPSKDTLKYYLLPKTTRVSEHFFNAFKCKVSNMSCNERICSFSVGSILLKPSLYYDIKFDRIIGFHDINGVQNKNFAKYAILLMVQGILEEWRQPIAYAFISEYDNIPEISMWIDEVLTSLLNIGLDIRVFVSDPRSEFLYASESRFVTPEKTKFSINRTNIFYTYDPLQLLKIVKNNLKSCDFYYGSTSQNSNSKEFFEKLDYLCNLLNAKSPYSNSKYKRAFSNKNYQKVFLNHMLHIFRNLKVVRKTDGADVTENMKFIESFQISIKSVQQLFESLQFLGVKCLVTSRLTHNSLERFFAQVKRGDSKDECTPRQFNKSFVRSFVFSLLKKPVSRDNFGDSFDAEEYAQELLDNEIIEAESHNNEPLLVHTTDYRDKVPEKNVFEYICRYCYRKCIQVHSCNKFKSYIRGSTNNEDNNMAYLSRLDSTVQISKMLPPEDFVEFLLLLEYKFKEFFSKTIEICSVGQEIFKEFEDSDYGFGMPCPCFPIDYLKALFIRVRLFYTIRKNNKLIKHKKGLKSFRTFNL